MRRIAWLGQLLLLGGPAMAEEPKDRTIIVTAPAALLDRDDELTLSAKALHETGSADLLGSLNRNFAGVSLSEAQGNPYQPDLIYRGFVASPLQGNGQGLAVYLDGGRFNQPFGDTVNFDLLPETAIDSVTIKDTSAVYGLNALGGAIIVATKTGRSAPGLALMVSGGGYGEVTGSGEAGWSRGAWSAYAAGEYTHDGGWRRHSPSTLRKVNADIGYDGATSGLHAKLTGADTSLTGNGSAPVELLAADRRAVFTYPDRTHNRFGRLSLHPWAALTSTTRIEASLYLQRLDQRTVNGDLADMEPCGEIVCLEDSAGEASPLPGTSGLPIAAPAGDRPLGVLNRTVTKTDAAGALIQFVDRRPLGPGENRLIAGASYDGSHTGFTASSELGLIEDDRQVVGSGVVIAQPDGSITPVALTARTRYSGLFLADDLPILPRLTAILGLRYNIAEVRLRDRIGTALNGRHLFRRLNPGAEFDYAVSPGLTLRLGYSQANRAPTPAELACAGPDAPCSLTNFFVGDPPLRQVVARSWEAGASGHSGTAWKLDWLLSAYRSANSDDIQMIASDVRGRAFFQNVGRTRRQGVEASIGLSHGALALRWAYAFTDATFRTPLTLNSPDNPSADEDGHILVRPGNRLPGVPRHRAIFSVEYDAGRLTIGGDMQVQSGQYLRGDETNLQPQTAAFALMGVHGNIRLVGSLSAFGEVTNLLDHNYATFGTFTETDGIALDEAPKASNPRSLSPGAPRRGRIGLKAKF